MNSFCCGGLVVAEIQYLGGKMAVKCPHVIGNITLLRQ